MRKRSNKRVSLLEFIRTGKFENVELNQTKEQISGSLSKPDCKCDMGDGISIWNYSAFEFHFIDEHLVTLWCDNLDYLKNPHKKQFRFDKWVFSKPKLLTLSYFCSVLNKEHIKFSIKGTYFNAEKEDQPDNLIVYIDNTDVLIFREYTKHDDSNITISFSGHRML